MYLPLTLQQQRLTQARLSARQRLVTGTLIGWEEGQGVVRLGKGYHPLKASDLLWLPADTLFALGAGSDSAFSQLWVSARLPLALPNRAGLISDPWLLETLKRAGQANQQQCTLLLSALAGELAKARTQPLAKALDWPVSTGPLADLPLIEAGRQGQHQQQRDIDPRPLVLTPV